MSNYTFLPEIVLRTPAKDFKSKLAENEIITFLNDQRFLESIFLASPSLYQAIIDYNQGKLSKKSQKDVLKSIAKYVIRNRTRSTPFGLFAGNSVLKWGKKTSISINENHIRKTQLDFNVINSYYDQILNDSELFEKVKFYPNSTYYVFQDEIRYIEKTFDQEKASFQISALGKNDFVLFVLNESEVGLTMPELIEVLLKEGVNMEEGREFIISLIESQILVDSLEPSLNATDKLEDLIDLHQNLGTDQKDINRLTKIQEELNQIDSQKRNDPETYPKLENFALKRAFHAESFFELKPPASLDLGLQKKILEALAVLNTLRTTKGDKDSRLGHFKARFKRRFGSDEVSLLIALDTEKGLGYDREFDTAFAPLIENIDLTQIQKGKESSTHKSLLEGALDKASEQNVFEIKLENENLGEVDPDLGLSASSSVLFRIIGDNKIFLEAAGGSSAINLICRFANTYEALGELVDKIAAEEIKNNPNVTFAEIIHLPSPQLGNVLSRKSVFDHEISFWGLGKAKNQIALRDLVVFIQDDKLFLKDAKSGQIIIPKLNCTHNVTETALPIYKFLFDLQFQGVNGGLKFHWGLQDKTHTFFPRVSFKGIILSLATWKFKNTSLNEIEKLKSINEFEIWQKNNKIPELFVISENDNELLIDTQSEFLVKLFIDSVKNKNEVTIKEFLFDKSQPVQDFEGKPIVNQLIGTLINSESIYPYPKIHQQKSTLKKVLISLEDLPESKWLFIKLYCPLASVDSIFSIEMENLLHQAFEKNLIDKWFFIRYRDPDFHLRVRFHIKDLKKSQELVQLLNLYLSSQKDIWKAETGNYEQETERYEAIGIETAENIFYLESASYLNFLSTTDQDNREEARWLYALKYIDDLLFFFKYSLKEKLHFVTFLRNGFAEEFGLTQDKKKPIDKLYRENRAIVNSTLASPANEIQGINIDPKCKENGSFEKSTLAGLTHMWVNRIMTTQPRLHELIIYDFLMRTYKSQIAQQKR